MKAKTNKTAENPLHRQYGLWSNAAFIAGRMLRFNRAWLPLTLLGAVTAPVLQYLWSFLTKAVLDVISAGTDAQTLVWRIAAFVVIQLAAAWPAPGARAKPAGGIRTPGCG